jgi:DNA modification methylase
MIDEGFESNLREPVMRKVEVEYVSVAQLKPNPRNARRHSKKQIHQIAASIREFGFNSPLIVDENGVVLIGNGRYLAALQLGLKMVPVIRLVDLTEEQKKAYAITDNRIGLNSSWDDEVLAATFKELDLTSIGFDLEITGFDTAEIDLMIDGAPSKRKADAADIVPAVQSTAITRTGDLWLLGEHKLLCADSRDPSAYRELMGDERARMVFTDPPYNVPIDGHVGGLGAIKHREFAMASGEMTPTEFEAFLATIFERMTAVSVDGAIHYVCMDWRHLGEVVGAGKGIYSEMKGLCVWNKDNGGMGSFYRSKHELVFVFKVGGAAHVNTVELGRSGRYRTNVWDYAGVNTLRAGRAEELAMHPTVKPVALVIDAIKDCSRRGDLVLDPFSGSGTTIMAAQKSGRRARAIELDPLYVDVAVRRWQNLTGQTAVLDCLGTKFGASGQAVADVQD